MRHLATALLLAAACGDDAPTCAEVYTEACRSAFDGECAPLGIAGYEDEIACIEAMSEAPRPGDVVGEFGDGMYGCRWLDPQTDLTECYRLTAHQACSTEDEKMAFSKAFSFECVSGYVE